MDNGSFGVRPGPSESRIEIWPSFIGESDVVSAKRSELTSDGFPSTLEMHFLIEVGVCGGGI